jgi:6-pyruvoyltetrahydropterin/6-carboxytetrahydropterin synthase
MEHYHVRIAQDDLVFSAAHFLTFEGDVCERLHGHDYRVAAEVHGPLDENHYVVDFLALRDALKAIVDELDHCVLLPADDARIRVTADEREVEATFAGRRWVFPRSDCLLLPIPSSTTELLARHVAQRLRDALEARLGARPARIRVEIQESCGMSAVCELSD